MYIRWKSRCVLIARLLYQKASAGAALAAAAAAAAADSKIEMNTSVESSTLQQVLIMFKSFEFRNLSWHVRIRILTYSSPMINVFINAAEIKNTQQNQRRTNRRVNQIVLKDANQ